MAKWESKITRKILLTYTQSLEIASGIRGAEEFTSVGMDTGPLSKFTYTNPARAAYVAKILKTKFSFVPDSRSTWGSDTGWVVTGTHEEVDWSKISYRIGVRELGLHSFVFAQRSTKVTRPISSPKPIWKVVLKTVEEIPPTYDPGKAWILYEVSFDDGRTWVRINPLDKPTRFTDDGTIVPRVVTVNAEMQTDDPETQDVSLPDDVTSVRLKYTFLADTNADPDGRSSPVLRNVKLLLYPRGGLSGSAPEQV